MQDTKRLAWLLWLCVLLFGVYYTRTVVEPNRNHIWSVSGFGIVFGNQGWSFNGLALLGSGLLIALIILTLKTYRLLRFWLHQQGFFDRQAKLPIRLKFLIPFVICFLPFRTKYGHTIGGKTTEISYGWGDPVAGPGCFYLIGLFFIVLQLYQILKVQVDKNFVDSNGSDRPMQHLPD